MTVLAPTAAEADALSTAFYPARPRGVRPSLLADRPDLGALFVHRPDPDGPPRVETFNLIHRRLHAPAAPGRNRSGTRSPEG